MSVKNNKVYRDVLMEVEKSRKLSQYASYYNALIKLKHSTEDTHLSRLIDAYVSGMPDIENAAKASKFTKAKEMTQSKAMAKNTLIQYCNSVLASGEPEWMVVARAHGWRPTCM